MIAALEQVNGYPRICINGELTENTLYRSFTPTAENIRRFAAAGGKA